MGLVQVLQLLIAAGAVANGRSCRSSSSSSGNDAAAAVNSRSGGGVVGGALEGGAAAAVAGGGAGSSSSGGVVVLRGVAAAADGCALDYYAALSWKVEVMAYLVEQGGYEVDVTDNMGNTPGHLAAEGVSGRGVITVRDMP